MDTVHDAAMRRSGTELYQKLHWPSTGISLAYSVECCTTLFTGADKKMSRCQKIADMLSQLTSATCVFGSSDICYLRKQPRSRRPSTTIYFWSSTNSIPSYILAQRARGSRGAAASPAHPPRPGSCSNLQWNALRTGDSWPCTTKMSLEMQSRNHLKCPWWVASRGN